ncbi:MAG: peptide deformylase [Acidobacteriota bacterium]|nr:peptide deformylase [Acidobacteriota bacterium]
MSVLQIILYGNPILTQKSKKIQNIDEDIVILAQYMVSTMHKAPGIGLAAPQVNHGIRLITVDLSVGENSKDLIILLNPEIFTPKGKNVLEEGCLSIPGINEKVIRPSTVHVKGIDLKGKEKIIEAEGLLARVLCHEIDHLDGKLFIDYLSPLKKNLIRKKLKKTVEEARS